MEVGELIWSIVLGAAGVLSLWLAGDKRLSAWIVGLGTQGLWLVYALVTAQYGFLISCAAFVSVYVRNLVKWKADDETVL